MSVRPAKRFFPTNTVVLNSHRGYMGVYPENTMLAYREAVNAGANCNETDIQRSSDGVVVGIHDSSTSRTTDGSLAVSTSTWAQLRALDAGVKFGAEFADREDTRIPRLEEMLDLAAETGTLVEYDVKATSAIPLAVEVTRMRGMARQVVFLGTTSAMEYVKSAFPDFAAAPWSGTSAEGSLAARLRVAKEYGYEVLPYELTSVTPAMALAAAKSRRPIRVRVATTSSVTINALINTGARWLMNDYITATKAALDERGIAVSGSLRVALSPGKRGIAPSRTLAAKP